MEDQDPSSSSAKVGMAAAASGRSWGRGRYNAAPRSERKSLEVFGGAPTSTCYLRAAGTLFGGNSVAEGEQESEAALSPQIDLHRKTPSIDENFGGVRRRKVRCRQRRKSCI